MARQNLCPKCNGRSLYWSAYDAFGCLNCDIWTEDATHCVDKEGMPYDCDSGFLHAPERPSLATEGKIEELRTLFAYPKWTGKRNG